MKRADGVIEELLPKVDVEELRDFVQEYAAQDTDFAVKLSQWLLRKYSLHANSSSAYVEEVRRLFGLTEEKYRSYNRHSYYDDVGVNWFALEDGMVKLVATLREKLATGCPEVVTPPVVEFYHLLAEYLDDFQEDDEVNIDLAGRACDELLLEWAECPDVPSSDKKAMYKTLRELSHAEVMDYVEGLSDNFFMCFLTSTQSPEEALKSIEEMVVEGQASSELVHKYVALLRQFGRDAEALAVIRKNLGCLTVLDAELERLYEAGDDYAAVNLIDLAMAQSQADSHIVERKVRFLKRLGDKDKLIEVYRYLLAKSWDGFDYYFQLKKMVKSSEWPEQYLLIVEACKAEGRSADYMARIYAEENDYPALYQALLVARYDILDLLAQYLRVLPIEYHANLLQKCYKKIEFVAHRAGNRSEYASVVSNIRRFAALPGTQSMVDEMVDELRTTYKRRSAYIDELSKL